MLSALATFWMIGNITVAGIAWVRQVPKLYKIEFRWAQSHQWLLFLGCHSLWHRSWSRWWLQIQFVENFRCHLWHSSFVSGLCPFYVTRESEIFALQRPRKWSTENISEYVCEKYGTLRIGLSSRQKFLYIIWRFYFMFCLHTTLEIIL